MLDVGQQLVFHVLFAGLLHQIDFDFLIIIGLS